jgi:hypothetical protein
MISKLTIVKYFFLLILIESMATTCKRENPTRGVTIKVRELSSAAPDYTLIYTSDNAGTQKNISVNAEQWSSGQINLETGRFMKVVISCTEPVYDFQVTILIDGGIWKQAELHSPEGTLELGGQISSI